MKRAHAAAALTVAVSVVAGCSSVTDPGGLTAAQRSFDAGHQYGLKLADVPPMREDPAYLAAACARAIQDSRVKDLRTGQYGEETDYVDADFVEGCNDAVDDKK